MVPSQVRLISGFCFILLQSGRLYLVSFSRPQITGLCFFLLAAGIAIHEHLSNSPSFLGNTSDLIVAHKDTKITPTDLGELAEQIAGPADNIFEDLGEKEGAFQVASGDSMMSLLVRIGVSRDEATQAIQAIKRVYDPRELKVGQDVSVRYRKDSSHNASLLSLSFKASHNNEIMLKAENGLFTAKKYEIALKKIQKLIEGRIDSSFYSAALKKGVPAQIVREAINALSYDINWQHDPSPGDPFAIVYDTYQDTNGNDVRPGSLKYVSFSPGGKNQARQVYRFQPVKGTPGYYDANGMNVVKSLLQTPMDPSKMRITSKFGRRKWNPVGYSTNHKGTDFGAPIGTPVRAAGDGMVIKANYWGHYGNIIQIKHHNGYVTAYAHLSAMHVKIGQRVRQGQMIGKVGRTGRTTGAHLHYEVIRNGVHVNPQSIKFMPKARLNSKDLASFRVIKQQIEKEVAEISPSQVASAGMPTQTS